jgi:hypothetical protein
MAVVAMHAFVTWGVLFCFQVPGFDVPLICLNTKRDIQ